MLFEFNAKINHQKVVSEKVIDFYSAKVINSAIPK
jgi:hypothetical protein